MRSISACVLISLAVVTQVYGQSDDPTLFDFWVGKWEGAWDDGNGKTGRGTNTIVRILDNAAIQENFRIEEGSSKGYLGTSISIFNPKKKTWHQAYADNQGAYFNFTGKRDGERRIFETETIGKEGRKVIQRMVFYDIKKESMMWDWESSEDGGATWKLNWRIHYRRV